MIKRLRAALLCDEVRTEDNGKGLFIGVYGNTLLAGQRPQLIQAVLVLSFDVEGDVTEVEVRMSAYSETIRTVRMNGMRGMASMVHPLQIALVEERELKVSVRNFGGDWIDCGAWHLTFAENAPDAPPEFAAQIQAMADQLRAAGPPAA